MYSDILPQIKTSEDRQALLVEIGELRACLFEPKQDLEDVLQSDVRAWVAEIIRNKMQNGAKLDEYLSELENELNKMEEVKVALAIEPTERIIALAHQQISAKAGSSVVIDFEHAPQLLGGAAISFRGKYHDGSVNKFMSS